MMSPAALRRAIAAVAVTLALAAEPAASAGRTRISATPERTWDPSFRHIVSGTTVVWRNPTDEEHSFFAYKGRWDKQTSLPPGESTRKRFKRAGTYRYLCTIHGVVGDDGKCRGMCGIVHVTRAE